MEGHWPSVEGTAGLRPFLRGIIPSWLISCCGCFPPGWRWTRPEPAYVTPKSQPPGKTAEWRWRLPVGGEEALGRHLTQIPKQKDPHMPMGIHPIPGPLPQPLPRQLKARTPSGPQNGLPKCWGTWLSFLLYPRTACRSPHFCFVISIPPSNLPPPQPHSFLHSTDSSKASWDVFRWGQIYKLLFLPKSQGL